VRRPIALASGLFAAACIAGLLVGEHYRWTLPGPRYNAYGQLIAYPGKQEVQRPAITPRTMVAFVFGQSNSANHGDAKFRATSTAEVNFWDGRYFAADDPLLGASGDGGGPWTAMANRLIAARTFDGVILIAAGISATSVQEWTAGGRLNGMLEQRLAETSDAGLTVTHFLWHQGEQDSFPQGAAAYDGAMQPIIALTKRFFAQSKFFVAQATICGPGAVPNVELRKAQQGLTRLAGVHAGPDTDAIGFADRYDHCHLNRNGLEKHAAGWATAIAAHLD
jgi:hypothetical protein